MNIRANVEKILTLHKDKSPDIQARMVVAYLERDDVISVGNGQLEDDGLYDDYSTLSKDYKSIGIQLTRW